MTAAELLQVGDRLDDVARAHVLDVLDKHHGNKARAARALGIHRRKLYRLLDRFAHDQSQSAEEQAAALSAADESLGP
jgi:DNA-binding NtrC family response regulator